MKNQFYIWSVLSCSVKTPGPVMRLYAEKFVRLWIFAAVVSGEKKIMDSKE